MDDVEGSHQETSGNSAVARWSNGFVNGSRAIFTDFEKEKKAVLKNLKMSSLFVNPKKRASAHYLSMNLRTSDKSSKKE